MAAKMAQIGFRVAVLAAVCVVGFYIGRPLYWKLTATLQDIREKDYTNEAVKQGFSDLMREAQNTVGWGQTDTIAMKIEELQQKDSEKKEGDATQTKEASKSADATGDKKKEEAKASKDSIKGKRLVRRLLAIHRTTASYINIA